MVGFTNPMCVDPALGPDLGIDFSLLHRFQCNRANVGHGALGQLGAMDRLIMPARPLSRLLSIFEFTVAKETTRTVSEVPIGFRDLLFEDLGGFEWFPWIIGSVSFAISYIVYRFI